MGSINLNPLYYSPRQTIVHHCKCCWLWEIDGQQTLRRQVYACTACPISRSLCVLTIGQRTVSVEMFKRIYAYFTRLPCSCSHLNHECLIIFMVVPWGHGTRSVFCTITIWLHNARNVMYYTACYFIQYANSAVVRHWVPWCPSH